MAFPMLHVHADDNDRAKTTPTMLMMMATCVCVCVKKSALSGAAKTDDHVDDDNEWVKNGKIKDLIREKKNNALDYIFIL